MVKPHDYANCILELFVAVRTKITRWYKSLPEVNVPEHQKTSLIRLVDLSVLTLDLSLMGLSCGTEVKV